MTEIRITVNDQIYHANLQDTPTAEKLIGALPIEGEASVWGEEIYFEIPVSASQESDAREEVEVGTIAYWPVGRAFCIFFGPTPVSRGEKPRAYSPVNVMGKIEGDLSGLREVQSGAQVQITLA